MVQNRKETEISLLGVDEDGGEEGDERVDDEVHEEAGDDERHSVGLPY